MRLLPCFLGPPGPRSWQADNVLVLGRPGGNTLGLPEEAHLLRLPAGRWKPLPHPLCAACLGQKNVLSQKEGKGWGWGVYTRDKWKIICPLQKILLSWHGIMTQTRMSDLLMMTLKLPTETVRWHVTKFKRILSAIRFREIEIHWLDKTCLQSDVIRCGADV